MSHSYDPAKGSPRVIPELFYNDATAAVDWLRSVFKFREVLRFALPDGRVAHADLELEGGLVMVELADPGYKNPKALKANCSSLVFFVSNVDHHYDHVKAAGAKIVSEPGNRPWGLRQYRVKDIEGHSWEFTQHLRDVPPEVWGAKLNDSAR